jgi:hypothetical protein
VIILNQRLSAVLDRCHHSEPAAECGPRRP